MRVLVVKTSSLGDVIHTLPALTDAVKAIPGICFDWVVEESFSEIPASHPGVDRVIPIAMRRWRKGWFKSWSGGEIRAFLRDLRKEKYDLIIDAQGLLFKSALIATRAIGPRVGYDRTSARDPWVTCTYDKSYAVSRTQHAIDRVRQLFAQALGYELLDELPDFGFSQTDAVKTQSHRPYLVFLHATTWPTKHWPLAYWAELIGLANKDGYEVMLPWGNGSEKECAEDLAALSADAWVLPRMDLSALMKEFRGAAGVVGLDSGLSHLAAALEVPGVSLYGPTRTDLTGVIGVRHQNLAADFSCAPCLQRLCSFKGEAQVSPACFERLPPQHVWQVLMCQLGN